MKYFKPNSVTWWASISPLAAGVFMAAEPVHGMTPIVQSIENATEMTPYMLINLGIAGVGLRGAIK